MQCIHFPYLNPESGIPSRCTVHGIDTDNLMATANSVKFLDFDTKLFNSRFFFKFQTGFEIERLHSMICNKKTRS